MSGFFWVRISYYLIIKIFLYEHTQINHVVFDHWRSLSNHLFLCCKYMSGVGGAPQSGLQWSSLYCLVLPAWWKGASAYRLATSTWVWPVCPSPSIWCWHFSVSLSSRLSVFFPHLYPPHHLSLELMPSTISPPPPPPPPHTNHQQALSKMKPTPWIQS